ncbi:MAG: hypothetical protein QOE92_70 [Chloroflexota bacterium]|jgi:hypothetical protein|nr:hypothetical protein [Chloroflexota bacterium]
MGSVGSCLIAIVAVVVFGVCPICAMASGLPPEQWIEEFGDDNAPDTGPAQAVVGPAPNFSLPGKQQAALPTPQSEPTPQQSQSSNPNPQPKPTPSVAPPCNPTGPTSLTSSSGSVSGGSNGTGGSWTVTGVSAGNVTVTASGMVQCGHSMHHTLRVVRKSPNNASRSMCNPTMGSSVSITVPDTPGGNPPDTITATVAWDNGCA